ncbi:MAG: pantoate--beta-alanine ligase [Candidatus Omnitrophica bacterium]|nr:pantoate--beta-alanine ligase [Candidatus Omnitrophota bacterium]
MKTITKPDAMFKAVMAVKTKGKSVGFVPTMGALHEGHLSLIRRARKDNDIVVVSIFVNPAQFAPGEDLKKYPRPVSKDIALCRKAGVDFIFYPLPKDIYPQGFKTYVSVDDLSQVLCGRTRPGHFRGVATVVAKLLNVTQPDILYLGQKDAQQAIIIKRMAEDLNFPVKVRVMSTVREKNGLALSSRNAYLNKKEKEDALVLFKSLNLALLLIKGGLRDAGRLIKRVRELISKKKSAKIDYIAIVNAETLEPLNKIRGDCLIALAVRIGKTRLIDNVLLKV